MADDPSQSKKFIQAYIRGPIGGCTGEVDNQLQQRYQAMYS